MENLEQEIMTLIASAGESKGKAFEALKRIKSGDFDGAQALIEESKQLDLEAHQVQTRLITKECDADSENIPMTLLMAHAQDHYMTSQLARELSEVLISIFKEQGGK